ncbi:hypothetical protein B0T22DRAFT_457188 [Podospora appendiculata]|uniref:Uncharacterized protein n=1 Tax=Podospora appendiculata TaxID=314037 RepID=A0AAE0X7U1_9PEZI|nr:hypothetical protein B0T22DRAFT_457188 [Podospora appendiculata]
MAAYSRFTAWNAGTFPDHVDAPERPGSPWYKKFGGWSDPLTQDWDPKVKHSAAAPTFPRLDPTYYAEDDEPLLENGPIQQPPNHELDRLFSSEKDQIRHNKGLRTWEATVLGQRLANGWSGGHKADDPDLGFMAELYGATVDEALWHPIWAKKQWFDFRVKIIDNVYFHEHEGLPGVGVGDWWSVDQPVIWRELRVAIELASRWMAYMADGPWLSSLRVPREERTEAKPGRQLFNATNLLLPHRDIDRVPYRLRTQPEAEPHEQKRVRREVWDAIAKWVAPRMVWTFFDEHSTKQPREWFIFSAINVSLLRPLINPESTLAERQSIRFHLANMLVHEAIHAINMVEVVLNSPKLPRVEPVTLSLSFFSDNYFTDARCHTANPREWSGPLDKVEHQGNCISPAAMAAGG